MTRVLLSSGLMAAAASPVHAGAWSIAGQGTLSGNRDDNVRFAAQNEVADTSGVADVSAVAAWQNDAFSFRASPRLVAVRYDVERAFNRNEQYLTLQTTKKTERGDASLSISGTQDTTLTSELGLTGLSDVNKKHRQGTLTLGNAISLTERVGINTQVYGAVSRYVDAQRTGLINYDYGSALLSTSYNWTERSRFSLQASAGKLQVPNIAAYDKVNLAITLGYRIQLATRWTAQLSFGPSQIRTQGRADMGTVYDATLTHDLGLTSLNLSISKDVTPTGFGLLSRREQAQFAVTHQLGDRWVTDWSALLSRNQNVLPAGGIEQDAVKYADLSGSLRWRITPTWNVALTAGYSQQRIGNTQSAAERRHAGLNISWNGLTRPLH